MFLKQHTNEDTETLKACEALADEMLHFQNFDKPVSYRRLAGNMAVTGPHLAKGPHAGAARARVTRLP